MGFIMTTLKIDTNDKKIINQLLNIAMNTFHLKVQVIDDVNITQTSKKTKWGKFAEKMDGLFTPDIVQHISTSRKEARDNFIANI